MNLKLTNAALDIFKAAPDQPEALILRGVIDPLTIDGLLTDTYQRETLGGSKMGELKKALVTSTVPDIELGMRGERIRCTDKDKGEYTLLDQVYIVDGLQRISAARSLLADKPDAQPRIGATIHFDTTFQWEKERFRILNQNRTKVSVNVLLRNAQSDFRSIDMLAKLCQDETFALAGRVQWQQNRLRAEVISALTLCRVAMMLHSQFGPRGNGNYEEMARGLDRTLDKVGRTTMRENVKAFFEVLDECFTLRKIVYANGAVQVKDTFLTTVAEVFSDYGDFWRENKFFIDRRLRLKIAKFPIDDPEVVRLSGAGGKARDILYNLFIDHINSGKRSRRLRLSDERDEEIQQQATGTAGR